MNPKSRARCKRCSGVITWLKSKNGKNTPVDGHIDRENIPAFDPKKHKFHRCDDGGGPGKRSRGPVKPRPLNLNFGEQPDEIKQLLSRPKTPAPIGIQQRIFLINRLWLWLNSRGVSIEELGTISKATVGLSNPQYFTVCSNTALDKLALALIQKQGEVIKNAIKSERLPASA